MRIAGERELARGRAALWETLNDPVQLVGALLLASPPEVRDEEHWSTEASFALGLGTLPLELDFTRLESRPEELLRFAIAARGEGVAIDVEAELSLADAGEGATALSWSAATQVHGPAVASSGQHALRAIVEGQLDRFLDSLEARDAVA